MDSTELDHLHRSERTRQIEEPLDLPRGSNEDQPRLESCSAGCCVGDDGQACAVDEGQLLQVDRDDARSVLGLLQSLLEKWAGCEIQLAHEMEAN